MIINCLLLVLFKVVRVTKESIIFVFVFVYSITHLCKLYYISIKYDIQIKIYHIEVLG